MNSGLFKCQRQFAHSGCEGCAFFKEGVTPLETRATRDSWYELLKTTMEGELFREEVQSNQQFPAEWKTDMLESLPILDTVQVFGLIEGMKKFKKKQCLPF